MPDTSSSGPGAAIGTGREPRPLGRLLVFVLLAYTGAWLVCVPLWLGQGLASPLAPVLLVAMMGTPTLAALVTHRLLPNGVRLGEVLAIRPGPLRHWWKLALVAWFGPVLATVAALAVAAGVGAYAADLTHFSGYARLLNSRGPIPLSTGVLVVVTLAETALLAPVINMCFALGEELGWRGFLRQGLSGRPRWLVVVVTGVVWALWHAPVLLLGYNYPSLPPLARLGFMIIFCTLLSAVLEWLRSASGTVWVSALAHGSLNGAAGLALLFSSASRPVSSVSTGLLGWSGWIVLVLVVTGLVASGRLRLSEPPGSAVHPSRVDDVQRQTAV